MRKFALEKVKLGLENEKFPIYKLKKIDGKYLFDEFYEKFQHDSLFKTEILQIETRILTIAEGNQQILPPSKFKQLKRDKSDPYVDYEIKTKHYRLYVFRDKLNRIIVLGGKKTTQEKDLKKFRKIKKDYFKN